MHLVIDLRFYRPEPYGLAIHIRDLFVELIPLLRDHQFFSKVTLILDKQNESENLSDYLPWWAEVEKNQKFSVFYSQQKYYSLNEQTKFLKEINLLKPDLMYFFTFNFPVLFRGKFIYQVLDLSIPKTRSILNPKVLAMLACLNIGLRKSGHILFLGKNTRQDAERFSGLNFTDLNKSNFRANTVIYNGINQTYLKTLSASKIKALYTKLQFSQEKAEQLELLLSKMSVKKPYFLFVSFWRKYKNIERLVEAFELVQQANQNKYQLVLAGSHDPKFPEIVQNVMQSNQYKLGNIIITGAIDSDKDLILLQDGAKAMVAPSLSEGFGLYIVEAANRGTSILASDIPIFHEILHDYDNNLFFDPLSAQDISRSIQYFINLNEDTKSKLAHKTVGMVEKFQWSYIAEQILKVMTSQLDS